MPWLAKYIVAQIRATTSLPDQGLKVLALTACSFLLRLPPPSDLDTLTLGFNKLAGSLVERWGCWQKREPEILSLADFDAYQTGKIFFILHGIVAYGDAFGVDHWTQFCEWIRPTTVSEDTFINAEQCSNYNQVDQGQ